MADRILLITYAFPPMWAPEALLSAKRMGNVPRYAVDVIAVDPPSGWVGEDPVMEAYVAERFGRIERVSRSPLAAKARFGRFAGIVRPPDEFRVFNGPVRRAAAWSLRRDDYAALVTWSQPHSTHLVGRALRHRFGLPWVAQLSDPWVPNPFMQRSALEQRLNQRLERSVFEAADRLVFTSAEAIALSTRGYPASVREKSRAVPHAFDPALSPPTNPPPPAGRTPVLRYVGAFYGPRTPAPLVRALAELDASVRVEIVGRVEEGMLDAPALPPGTLNVREPVHYVASLRLMREADGLLIVDAPGKRSPFLPSKLVDYLGSGRPIAALTPEGPAAELTRRVGGHVADPADPDACVAALRALLEEIREGRGRPPGAARVVEEHMVATTGAAMAAIFDEVLATSA